MQIRNLDVLITASSRPQLINYCFESFEKNVHFSGERRYLLHEDFVYPTESMKVVRWAEAQQKKGYKIDIYQTVPAEGLGTAIDKMFSHTQARYAVYLQEDWEFERPIDLDRILWTMEEHENEINSVVFFKYRIAGVYNKFRMEEFNFSGLRLCLYNAWPLLPAVWRMDFVRSRWTGSKSRPEGHFTNALGSHQQRMSHAYCRRFLGVYLYGPQGDYRYVRHLGNSWRMAAWRLEDGKPGGNEIGPIEDAKARAPWLPDMPSRPSNKTESGWYPEPT